MIINDIQFNCELEDILKELRNQLNINHINLLHKTKNSGNDIMVQCPYHGNGQEKRPSAGIRKTDGQFHCFACNETHTLPEVISFCFGHTDDMIGAFGWSWLLKNFASIRVEERKDVELDFSRDSNSNPNTGLDKNNSKSNRNTFVKEEELDNYRYIHPYMYERKLTDEVIELFDIGYDKASDCLTFPIRNINGDCIFIARRSVKTKWFNYPEGVEKPLYGLYEMSYAYNFSLGNYPDEVIVCESMLDALSFWTIDKCAVALNGLGNELQFKQLRELPVRKLILATDSDTAGMKARARIRANVKNKIITEYIFPPGRKDANECTQEELKSLREMF